MPSIAIIDDRKGKRETLQRAVNSTLRQISQNGTWNVVADGPPAEGNDILQWLDEHDSTVLVTDWKLNEGAGGKQVVNYQADRLIGEIRRRRPTFPIYVVTGFTELARTHLKDVENIFDRTAFTNNINDILPQMLRAGQRRFDEHRLLLAQVDELARKTALGTASEADKKSLRTLQSYFQTEMPVIKLDGVLGELEAAQARADALRRRISDRLKHMKK